MIAKHQVIWNGMANVDVSHFELGTVTFKVSSTVT